MDGAIGNGLDGRLAGLLRRHLRYLDPAAELTPGSDLRSLGLDSMAAVALMLDVEDEFGVVLPDSSLVHETFATPASLWAAVTTGAAGGRD
jgi:acyl carrier protein